MVSEFRLTRRVEFSETDAAGIVHFSNYFRYMEAAEHALWRSAGLGIHREDDSIGWPRVSTSFEYIRPLRFEDEFDVLIRVVGKTAKTISYAATVEKDGQAIASGKLTIVCVHRAAGVPMQAIPLPADIDQVLQVNEDEPAKDQA